MTQSGMPWFQLNETIERLRRDAALMEKAPSATLKSTARDIRRHIEELERERAAHDPRPHIL